MKFIILCGNFKIRKYIIRMRRKNIWIVGIYCYRKSLNCFSLFSWTHSLCRFVYRQLRHVNDNSLWVEINVCVCVSHEHAAKKELQREQIFLNFSFILIKLAAIIIWLFLINQKEKQLYNRCMKVHGKWTNEQTCETQNNTQQMKMP